MDSDPRSKAMLAVIKEADSRLGTGADGAKRTFDFNLEQSLPLFARGDPLRAWMWGESIVGSVRLAAKRALLDARTATGKKIAWQGYLEAEELIRKECERNAVPYHPELGLETLELIEHEYFSDDLEITKVHPWEELEGALRRVKLNGDPTLFPYAAARIESKVLSIDEIAPLSLYALAGQIDLHEKLRKLFLANYALDFLDLSGTIEFRMGGKNFVISPPTVEVSGPDGNRCLLIDGLHRFLLTDKLGISRARTVVVSDVPDRFPLIPLPLRWEEVTIHEGVPPEMDKRRFRFPDLQSFPDISGFSQVPVTEENCRYFFYRDYSPLGSSGIREPGKKD
ncbi:hypothetical protein M1345_01740 [Patescibacteria group bacterium]|nr:hypothetical protein [Patescibacteria group bacterium]